jgi:hypothetical protein
MKFRHISNLVAVEGFEAVKRYHHILHSLRELAEEQRTNGSSKYGASLTALQVESSGDCNSTHTCRECGAITILRADISTPTYVGASTQAVYSGLAAQYRTL